MTEDSAPMEAVDDAAAPDAEAPAEAPSGPSSSAREALQKAFAARDEGEAAPEADAEGGPVRDDRGRFAPKQADEPAQAEALPDADDVPSRFSGDAKALWDKVPAPVRGEVSRAIREIEGGLQQYRERWEPLKQFDEMARQHGTTIHEAMGKYVAIEQKLAQDLVGGLDAIARNAGTDLRAIAAHVLGQPAPQGNGQLDAAMRKIAALEQQLQSVGKTAETWQQEQKRMQVERTLNEFAASRPRFNELVPDMQPLIEKGLSLEDAYAYAERMNPPAPAAAQTRKPRSPQIAGAPSDGSDPTATRPPAKSAREALQRAFGATS